MANTTIEKGDNRRYLIISDTHFGASNDETAGEGTSIEGIKSFLDHLEKGDFDDVGNIILLGDVLDLWRTEFEKAFNEAKGISFFTRLSNYAKENNTQINYVIGNHDHYIKEIDFSHKELSDFGKSQDNSLENFLSEPGDNVKKFFQNYNMNLRYPHYVIEIPEIGVTVFEHGHYADGTSIIARSCLRALVFISRQITEIKNKSFGGFWGGINYKLRGGTKRDTPSWKIVMKNMESTLSAGYSTIYFSKFNKKTRENRDYIYNNIPTFLMLAGAFVMLLILFGAALGGGLLGLVAFAVFAVIIVLSRRILFKKVVIPVLRYLGIMGLEGVLRGNTVKDMMEKIKNDDITLRRNDEKKYSYYNLLIDFVGNKYSFKGINLYVFGHTHVAGYYHDKENNFKICNTGSWVKKTEGETDHCTSSFVLIDPKKDEPNRVKVCRIEKGEVKTCEIDKDGNCDKKCKVK